VCFRNHLGVIVVVEDDQLTRQKGSTLLLLTTFYLLPATTACSRYLSFPSQSFGLAAPRLEAKNFRNVPRVTGCRFFQYCGA
jgi:hypothetical protein